MRISLLSLIKVNLIKLGLLIGMMLFIGCDRPTINNRYSVDFYIGDSVYRFHNVKQTDIKVSGVFFDKCYDDQMGESIQVYHINIKGVEYKSSYIVLY